MSWAGLTFAFSMAWKQHNTEHSKWVCRFDEARRDRGQKYEGMNLYIKNLVDEVDDAELRAEFLSFGTITSAKVMRNPQGKSKGFGFVCYSSFEEATRAVTEMSGRMLHDKPLYVAMAQRSEQRKAQLQQRYQQPAGFMGPHMGPMGPMGPPMPGMNGPMSMYPGAMPPYMQGPGPRGMGPRGYPRGPPGPMMYPPMMPQVSPTRIMSHQLFSACACAEAGSDVVTVTHP